MNSRIILLHVMAAGAGIAPDAMGMPVYDPTGVVRVLVHARCPVLTLLD